MNLVNVCFLSHYVKETTKKGLCLDLALINDRENDKGGNRISLNKDCSCLELKSLVT